MDRIISLRWAYFSLIAFALFALSCGQKKQIPDVSGIPVNIHIERFDTAFFALDSNNTGAGLYRLNKEFPWFTNDFLSNILGAGPLSDTNRVALPAARQFLVSYLPVKDSIEEKYKKLDWLEKELKRGMQFVKYYFPGYPLPQRTVTYIGPFDGPGVAITPNALAIGLQLYAGKKFSFYLSGKGQDLYPVYISRRFEPAYITSNCMQALAEDLFPDNSDNKTLVEKMIEKGRYWWLADKFLPETADSLKTGFTQKQLDWCQSNEGLIWNYLLQNTDLFTRDPDVVKLYIGEGPKTQGMPDASPGNIGQWAGWQIVKKYVENHPGIQPGELMQLPARKIFDESKYKPR